MTVATAPLDELDVYRPETYGANGYPHEAWRRLRAEDPLHRFEPDGYRPFWAVTKHADVKHIGAHPEQFLSAPRLTLQRIELEDALLRMFPDTAAHGGMPLRTLVNMDPPDHADYRNLAAPLFRPRVLRNLEARTVEITRMLLDRHTGAGVELDFVSDLAAWHPLRVICEILGVAAEDEGLILRLTNEMFGFDDPEFAPADIFTFMPPMYQYFARLVIERRDNPREDLASVLAAARLPDGSPLDELELLSYFVIVATAGHDTTRNSLSGGMLALLQNPDELDKLRANPDLLPLAADEIVRWTSPVIHFIRTAATDCELRGKEIEAGDSLVLFYPSANRDEEVFEDPDVFRVDRDPNPHVGFGHGEHFCLGANLARMEIRAMLSELLARLESVELCGDVEYMQANFVGGVKHLPIRWTVEG